MHMRAEVRDDIAYRSKAAALCRVLNSCPKKGQPRAIGIDIAWLRGRFQNAGTSGDTCNRSVHCGVSDAHTLLLLVRSGNAILLPSCEGIAQMGTELLRSKVTLPLRSRLTNSKPSLVLH
jgi:hypothetical protein